MIDINIHIDEKIGGRIETDIHATLEEMMESIGYLELAKDEMMKSIKEKENRNLLEGGQHKNSTN